MKMPQLNVRSKELQIKTFEGTNLQYQNQMVNRWLRDNDVDVISSELQHTGQDVNTLFKYSQVWYIRTIYYRVRDEQE
jgi:hypothetical protein